MTAILLYTPRPDFVSLLSKVVELADYPLTRRTILATSLAAPLIGRFSRAEAAPANAGSGWTRDAYEESDGRLRPSG